MSLHIDVYVMIMFAVPSALKLLLPKCCTSISYWTSVSPPHLCCLSLAHVAIGGVDQNLPVQVSALRPGGVAEQWVFLLSLDLSSSLPFPFFSQGLFISPSLLSIILSISLYPSLSPSPLLSFLVTFCPFVFVLFVLSSVIHALRGGHFSLFGRQKHVARSFAKVVCGWAALSPPKRC